MPYDTLLFDLDGTLVDSLPDLTDALNRLLRDLSLTPLTHDQVKAYVGDGATLLVQRALPEGCFCADHLRTFLAYYQQQLSEKSRPYPGIPALLASLADLPKAVVTNKPLAMAERLLQNLELRDYFKLVLGGDSCVNKKPHPEPLLLALETLDSRADRTLMVGDHHTDLRAAAAAGVDALFCRWGYGNDGGEVPRYSAASIDDLQIFLRPR